MPVEVGKWAWGGTELREPDTLLHSLMIGCHTAVCGLLPVMVGWYTVGADVRLSCSCGC